MLNNSELVYDFYVFLLYTKLTEESYLKIMTKKPVHIIYNGLGEVSTRMKKIKSFSVNYKFECYYFY